MTSAGSSRPSRRSAWWNLLLLVPMLLVVPPVYDFDQPRLLGMPAFYWIQFLFVPVGVVSVGVVYWMTRNEPARTGRPDRLSVDDLDTANPATPHDEESDQ